MRRLLTPGWVACHLLMVLLVAGMLGLAGWQYVRAAGGNAISWGYLFQWPVFAGFVVFIWVREIRRVLRGDPPAAPAPEGPAEAEPRPAAAPAGRPVITRRTEPAAAAYDDSDDPELAAYNRYLAWLSAHPGARPVDYSR